jgi:predicted O-linked N-acetylglucosamine transferase (SPINDLY family)
MDTLSAALQEHQEGRLVEAEQRYRRILDVNPDEANALHLLGMLCHQTGRTDEALELLRRSIELSPSTGHFHSNLAGVLGRSGRPREAIPHLREAIRLQPTLPQAHNNLGVALEALDQLEEADAAYREAIRLNRAYAEAYCNLGNVLQKRGPLRAAVEHYRKALELKSDLGDALANSAAVLGEMGQLDEAISCYRKTIALRPDNHIAHSSLLFTLHYHPAVDAQELFSEHVWWGEQHARRYRDTWRRHDNDRSPGRRLRLGYVSPDFRAHPVSRFFEPILRSHDRQSFQVACYSDAKEPDSVTQGLRRLADVWRETRGIADDRLADLIRQDRIDILVDLTGHMADHRLLVFARKPAPVQVSYIGYPDTTGVTAIDYRLTDSIHDPPGETERYHTEQLVRLDPCCWCYMPDDPHAAAADPPARGRSDRVTFACLNRLIKVTPPMLRAWGEILQAVPESRLILLGGTREGDAAMVQEMCAPYGIDPSRLEPVARIPRGQYVESYRNIDICLDTFPYNGHTTTCDAAWMGVPTVTLVGSTHVSRAGLNVLTQLGLPDLATQTVEDYVATAVGLARDRQRLATLRQTLRNRMRCSALRDERSLCVRVERAYRWMWERWCETNAPAIVR